MDKYFNSTPNTGGKAAAAKAAAIACHGGTVGRYNYGRDNHRPCWLFEDGTVWVTDGAKSKYVQLLNKAA